MGFGHRLENGSRSGEPDSTKTACLGALLGVFVMVSVGLSALIVVGYHSQQTTGPSFATARLTAEGGVEAEFSFLQRPDGVQVMGYVSGLQPHARHGLSLQTYVEGGGTFNPLHRRHSCPDDNSRRLGDLGNVHADARGVALYHRMDKLIALGGKHTVLGRLLLLHAHEDDCYTQPSGGAGASIAAAPLLPADPTSRAAQEAAARQPPLPLRPPTHP